MTWLAVLICAAIGLSTALGVYLRLRQIAWVAGNRDAPPGDFAATVTIQEHRRAADYTLASTKLAISKTIFEGALALVWLLLWLPPLYGAVAAVTEEGLSRSALLVIAFGLLGDLLIMPFDFFETFRLDARFGLNHQSLSGFLLDELKMAGLQLAIGAPLLYALFALIRVAPENWHLYAFAGFLLFVFALTALYPTLIAPLFNKFQPLPEGELRARLERLLAQSGFASGGLFVMDASARSSRGNAYFSGFGKAKRIVLFDTLIARHSPEEIESVLAHELGHYKRGHIRQSLALMALVSLAGFFALHWALGPNGLAAAFGAPADVGVGLIIALLAKDPVTHVLSPLFAWRSRKAEFEADDFARRIVGKEPMISALTRLTRDNLATLTPDVFYARFYYSHPPASVRVAHLRAAE
ncbi:MAG TPA: M48 family metallopeptidase [Methylocystis sp.]|nr:M48 family metallopeptidase [Methylocystis sp.]